MIYLDQAATSFPKPAGVAEAMCKALETVGNSGRGIHSLSLAASRLVFTARLELARFFGAEDPSTIAFTANATESLNLALFGLLNAGDHVITTALEHNSVLRPLYLLEQKGVEVTILPADSSGQVDFTSLEDVLRANTKALVCTHASNLTGNLIDLDFVAEFCKQHGLLLILDAAQTAGWYPYNLAAQSIDVLCFTGHKALYGPQGIGGIYVRPGLSLRPLKTGGSGVQTFAKTHPQEMPEALEAGTLNTPGIAGLMAGVRYLQGVGLEEICQVEARLTEFFYHNVREIPGIQVYGDFTAKERCPIIALNVTGLDPGFVSQCLAEEYGVLTRSGGHCAPLMHEALGTRERGAVRFSFSHLNTMEELEEAINALKLLAREGGVKDLG
ncbi:MAG: aminotransferase class V-fold PLP-dependent enzyme [Firmicutes bacterium]|nr:aminotransferase class V-fold PLP-dependent enzyme [Bacillota bacterium]